MNPFDEHTDPVADILRGATSQLDVPTVGLAAVRSRGARLRRRRRAAVAGTCAVLLVAGAALTVQRLSATPERSTAPASTSATDLTTDTRTPDTGVASSTPTVSTATATTEAGQGVVGEPVERVDPAFVWNLVVPGSAEAIGSLQWGIGVTEEAPYLAWSTAPGPSTDGNYQPTLYRSDDGIHWAPASNGSFTEPEVSRRGLAAQGDTLFAFGTAAATAAIPKGGAGDAVVDISTDQGASWEHQVLPIDLRGLAATDGVMSVGLSGGMAAADGVVVVVAQPYVTWEAQGQRELAVTSQGAYTITYPTCEDCVTETTMAGIGAAPPATVPEPSTPSPSAPETATGDTAPAETMPADTAPAATGDTLPIISELIPLSELGIDPASVEATRTPRAFFSTDGATFTEASFPELPAELFANGGDVRVFAAAGQFYMTLSANTFDPSLAYGYSGGQLVYRSADGSAWEQVGELTSPAVQELLGVLPDGTMVGRSYSPNGSAVITTSVDGVTWQAHDLSPLIEPDDGAIVSIDLWAITVDDEGITAIGNVSNDPIAEAGGRSIERDGVRLEIQSSRNSFLRAYDADTGDELPQQRLSYTNSGSIEVLAGDGSVRATFTGEEQQQLYGFQDGGRLTKVLLHSDDGMRWSRENLADLTGSTEAGPGFIQQHDGKVLITLVDPAQRTDAMATTMVLVGTRK